MKKLFFITLVSIAALYVLINSSINKFNRDEYVNQYVLDMASPLDVSIDTEFLNGLTPAYE